MNKHQKAEIEAVILKQIELLLEEIRGDESKTLQTKVQLERLHTALKRINADNFGECFKCERPLPYNLLKERPETMICSDCSEDK